MDFVFNNCGLSPSIDGISQKQMSKTLLYAKFCSQQFHLQSGDWPEKQTSSKDISKRDTAFCYFVSAKLTVLLLA